MAPRQSQTLNAGSPPTSGARRGVAAARQGDTFEAFDLTLNPAMRPAYEQCRRVARGEAWCALLMGGYGNGKSHLAIAALIERHNLMAGFFWKTPDWLSWVKRRAFDDNEPIDAVLASYQSGDALIVFDDLGAENQTDWASEQLYRVLDARYESRLPTILTTNIKPELLDGRIVDRFRSGLVPCGGESVRGKLG